ncbi:hypothetical protein ABZ957_37275, partial [Streptomyces sp. NPDC046316]
GTLRIRVDYVLTPRGDFRIDYEATTDRGSSSAAGAWHAEWEPLRELLRLVGGAAHGAAELASGLRVHADVMRHHLDLTGGSIVSERLSAALAPLLGRAGAKELLTELARRARAEGRPLSELLADIPETQGLDLGELTDPTRYTGSAGDLTDRALERP